jgi:hypothetical protein
MLTRSRIIVAAAALVVAIAAVVAVVETRDSGDDASPATSHPSTSTTSSTTSTTVATSPTTPPPPGSVAADATGALLAAPPPPVTKSTAAPTADCHVLGDGGWSVAACATVTMAGGERAWLTEHRTVAGSATDAWRAYVLHWSQGKGAWLVDLRFEDDAAAQVLGVDVIADDLTGDAKPELVFGFHYTGSEDVLGYDVVADGFGGAGDDATARVHRELAHGAAMVGGGKITDYGAQYPNGEPNCCPAYVQESTVSYQGGAWYVAPVARRNAAGPGNL